jgi:sugar O-acyltransferase (sialic acid O-acetyltransferase NeuD family)
MNKNVILFGNGGHARVITDIIKENNDHIIGFLTDPQYGTDNVLGLKWLGAFDDCLKYANEDTEFILAYGNNQRREEAAEKYQLKWYTGIHPTAVIDPTAVIEEGTVVMARAVINSCAHIGKHSIINTGCVVEHDNRIGNYTHLSPLTAVCGTVTIGDRVHLGAGTTVINNINICSDVTVGAGSTVIHDITEPGTYVGVPAKKIH